MELNSQHRAALLSHLKETQEKLELNKAIQLSRPEATFADWRDIDMFLEQERIALIENSLINNQIDF